MSLEDLPDKPIGFGDGGSVDGGNGAWWAAGPLAMPGVVFAVRLWTEFRKGFLVLYRSGSEVGQSSRYPLPNLSPISQLIMTPDISSVGRWSGPSLQTSLDVTDRWQCW